VTAPPLSYRRLVANVLAGAGGRIAAVLVALALTTVLVRTLGVAAYGTWSFFFVLLGFNAQLDLGLSVAIERAVARAAADEEPARIPPLIASGLALAAGLSAVLQPIALALPDAWLAALGDPAPVRRCLLVLPACLFCSNAAAVAGAGLSGLQRTTTLALQRTTLGGAAAIGVSALALAGVRRLDLLLVVYAAGLAAAALVSWRAVSRAIGTAAGRPWPPERAAIGELLRLGGTLQATTLIAQLGDQAVRVLLGSRFGAAAMGTYDLASRAAIAPRSIVASLLVALVPFAAGRERRHGRAALADSLWIATKYTALLIVPATAAGVAVAGPLMAVWLGAGSDAARETQPLFEILIVALSVQSIAGPMIALGRADGRPGPEAVSTAIGLPLATAVAASRTSAPATVAAFAVTVTASIWIAWVYLQRALGVSGPTRGWLGSLSGLVAGGCVVGWAARAITPQIAPAWLAVIVVPAAVAAVLVTLALAIGAIPATERAVFRDVLRRRPGA